MKKIFFTIFFFLLCSSVSAKEMISTTFVRCESNDTYIFLIDGIEVSYSLLGLEYQGNNFACNLLEDSMSVLLEYDEVLSDAYGRSVAWIWVDESLLQELIIKVGYGSLTGDYKYTKELCQIQDIAIEKEVGIWKYNTDKGICAKIDYSSGGNIEFDDASVEVEKSKTEEIEESLEKIDNALTNLTDNNMDKIGNYYLYGFIILAFIVFVIQELKK